MANELEITQTQPAIFTEDVVLAPFDSGQRIVKFPSEKLSPENEDLTEAWKLKQMLEKERRKLMACHDELKLQIAADGKNDFGENMDPRMIRWGQQLMLVDRLEKKLRMAKPELYRQKESDSDENRERTKCLDEIIREIKGIKQKNSEIKVRVGEDGKLIIKVNVYGNLEFIKGSANEDTLHIHNADVFYCFYFNSDGEAINFFWVDLQKQRQDNDGKSDYFKAKYTVGIPVQFLSLDKNKKFLEMILKDLEKIKA